MSSKAQLALILACFGSFSAPVDAAEKLPPGVACLLEDNAAELLPQLTNPQGDSGDGQEEKDVVFSGKNAIKITRYQKYCNFIPGWAFRITENPREGEYRYLRFAWKSDGLTGIMVQLHDDKDWHIRYTAGANKFGWATLTVAEIPPAEWTANTIDLFKDFGERELHGIALTAFDGIAGYFDHIYLARSIEDLDFIDATGLSAGGPIKLTPEEVEENWRALSSPDASVAYRSFWTLAASGDSAMTVLAGKLGGTPALAHQASIKEWIRNLDDDQFAIREDAMMNLTAHFTAARELIEQELLRTKSAEVRERLRIILDIAAAPPSDAEKIQQQTRHILRIIAERKKAS